jgi:LAS superfamily LD-carboxypeptidase LdcB
MRKKRLRAGIRFLKRHLILIISILLSVGVFVGWNSWFTAVNDQAIRSQDQSTLQHKQEASIIVTKYRIKKEAEEKAKQEAAEAAAKSVAEQSKNGMLTPADSKLCNTGIAHIDPATIDVVVNKKHCVQPLNYVPADLVTSQGATLSAKALDAYKRMYGAATAAGQSFYVTSSYRSYTTQLSTYKRWVSISGQASADTYSARPGYSEHQTGFAFDVAANGCTLNCFGSTSQYQWFQKHAAEYGFIQRYYAGYETITGYSAEEWHYRYVGVEVAQAMQVQGIKTLEQYRNVTGGDY